MEQWLPRRPLILAPIIPLIWTVSWLGIATALRELGYQQPDPRQWQDSVLLVSAFVVIANIYNLILIYQRAEQHNRTSVYLRRSFLLAIILIISIVLAWGQPKTILIPNQLTSWVVLYILLNLGQALLGIYFINQEDNRTTNNKLASIILPVGILTATGIFLPLVLTNRGNCFFAVGGGALLIALGYVQWLNVPGLFCSVAATRSGFYQFLLGLDIMTTMTTIVFGLDTVIMMTLGGRPDLISYCFAISLIGVGISDTFIAAMQRYHNDYRYGHARGYEIWYLIGGIILTVAFLLLNCWLVA